MMEVEGVVSYMHCDSVDRKTSPQAWIWLGYMFQHNKSTHYYKYMLAKKNEEKKNLNVHIHIGYTYRLSFHNPLLTVTSPSLRAASIKAPNCSIVRV